MTAPAGSASLSGPTRRRGEILHAAATLFAREGYRGTSMREVATAAGIQAGSLYHHFPGGFPAPDELSGTGKTLSDLK